MPLALTFPGQGAQHIGMGVDVADTWASARAVFDEASEALGLDLYAICRDGPKTELVRTDVQQPAILTVGAAVTEALRESGALRSREGADADVVACFGLSLGEFTALYAAGALQLADAVRLVRERGLGMQEASEAIESGMTALRCEADVAASLCDRARARTNGVIGVANLNAPGQVVISGDIPSLDAAEALAREEGVRRPTRLPVAGAFHSALMQPGADRLAQALEGVTLSKPRVPIISNVTAEATTDPDILRDNLIRQVTSPVRFVECVHAVRTVGADRAIEPAPGRVNTSLIRRIDPDLETVSASDADAVKSLATARVQEQE